MRNAPAVDAEGRVYVSTQGRLVALQVEEDVPAVLWEYVIGSHIPGPIAVAPDGTLRAHSADGFLHAVSTEGRQAWSPAHVGEPLGWAAPLVDVEGNTWISAYDGGLIHVSAGGRMSPGRYFRSRQRFDSTGLIQGGVLYIGAEDGYMFAIRLDPQKGENLWDHSNDLAYAGGFVNSAPVMTEGGVLVVAARNEKLVGFSPTGSMVWHCVMPGQLLGSPVIDRHGHLYVAATVAERGRPGRGFLVCVDGNSHKVRWQYATEAPIESTPAVGDDGLVYFGDNSGTIHAVGDRGMPEWTAKVECAVRSAATIPAAQRVAFGLDDDTLVVLKCSSQSLSGVWPKLGRTLGQSGSCP
jgi:outer membrane protein assembly factor BamB